MTISKRNASKRRKSKQIDEGKVAPKAEEAKATLAPPPKGSKLKKLATRCISATIMFLAFTAIVYTGHLTVAGTMIMLQVFTFRELVNLRYIEAKEKICHISGRFSGYGSTQQCLVLTVQHG